MRRLCGLLIVLICTLTPAAFAQLPLLDTLSRDPTDDQAYGELPWDSIDKTSFPPACSPGYCIMGFDTVSGMFDCGPCSSGSGGTECSTSPCDLDAATTQDGQGICLADGTNCPAFPTTPTPILTTTPYPTPTVTATSTWNSPTPTATPTQTQTPEVCFTDSMGRGGLIGAHPGKCGSPIATVTPTPTETTTPTPQLTAAAAPTVCQTVCTGIGCIGGLRADNPPICNAIVATETPVPSATPTGVGTPAPVQDNSGTAGTQPRFAAYDHEHGIYRISTVPNASTGSLLIKPSSVPSIGSMPLFSVERTTGDPIFALWDRNNLDGNSRFIQIRLDNGTTPVTTSTSSQKPFIIYNGATGNPVHVAYGNVGQIFDSVVTFDDVDLEYGSMQSYVTIDSSNTNSFFTTGFGSNILYQGTGGDTSLATDFAHGATFSGFSTLSETGNGIHRTAAGFQGQVLIGSDGGTTSTAEYWLGWMREGGVPACTYPAGTCVDMIRQGGLYLNDMTFAPETSRYSIKSIGATVHMEHAGAIYIRATPTAGPTETPGPTATSTASSTATATAAVASATPTAATPTPTPVPTASPFLINDGISIDGCIHRSLGGTAATNANTYTEGNGASTFQNVNQGMVVVPTVIRGLTCSVTTDVPWGRVFGCDVEKAWRSTCRPASDGGFQSCAWKRSAAGACLIRGTLRNDEQICAPNEPSATVDTNDVLVTPKEYYHIALRMGLASGNATVSWYECPLGPLK